MEPLGRPLTLIPGKPLEPEIPAAFPSSAPEYPKGPKDPIIRYLGLG